MSDEQLDRQSGTDESPFMHIIVRRVDVEQGAIEDTVKALAVLQSDEETAIRYQNHVALSFRGYDDDPRGLFQIQTVCDSVRKLNEKWYAWFFFMTKDLEISPLAVIALCCCPRYTVSRSGLFIPELNDLRKFLWFQFGALRGHCQLYNLSPERTESEVREVIEYLMKVGFVSGSDLPRLDVHSAKTGRWIQLMRGAGN